MFRLPPSFRQLYGSRRRRRQPITSVELGSATELMEHRDLLTLAMNFDFTIIGSNPSDTLRHFDSVDPADAPFEVIRYGHGSVTSVNGLDGGELITEAGDLSFEFGSINTSNPVRALVLDSFDSGQTDGVADQVYAPGDNSTISFSYRGIRFAEAQLEQLILHVTPDGLMSGSGNFDAVLETNPSENPNHAELAQLINESFASLGPNGGLGGREFTLEEFNFDDVWEGAAGGQVFTSPGTLNSLDDVSDSIAFAKVWDISNPVTATGFNDSDVDWFKAELDPAKEYTLRVSEDGDGGFIDVVSDVSQPQVTTVITGKVFEGNTTTLNFRPNSPTTYFRVAPVEGMTYTLEIVDSTPASVNVHFIEDFTIAWSPEFDDQGNALPTDGYRIQASNDEGVFYSTDVGNGIFQHSLDGHLSLLQQKVTVGRIVDGEVVTWSDPELLDRVAVPGVITSFNSRAFTWQPIPGAARYELVLESVDQTITLTETSYTLPDDHPLGWRKAWVRAIDRHGEPGKWSAGRDYHARSQLETPTLSLTDLMSPEVHWTPLAGATSYNLFLVNKTSNKIRRETGLTGTSWKPASGLEMGSYDIWMQGVSEDGLAGRWSSPTSFTIAPYPDSLEGDPAQSLTFSWRLTPGTQSVDLYVSNRGRIVERNGLTGTSWIEDGDWNTGNVHWWVRGTDSAGNKTQWSARQTSRVGSTRITDGPTGVLENGAELSLSWLPVVGAESYEVLIRSYTDGDVLHTTGLTSTTLDQIVLEGNRYKAWINTVFPSGANSYSPAISFDVKTNDTRVLIAPTRGFHLHPVVEWISDAQNNPTNLWLRNLGDDSNTQIYVSEGTSYSFQNALKPGTYRLWASSIISKTWSKPITFVVPELVAVVEDLTPATNRLLASPLGSPVDETTNESF